VNWTLIGVLCPAVIVIGSPGPATEKCLSDIEASLIVSGAEPELVAVTIRTLLLPGATLPKSRLVAPKARAVELVWFD
jgi:hypothetical protein